MKELLEYLESMPLGPLKDTQALEGLLSASWDELRGDGGGMEGGKLHGRMEAVTWEPPLLEFSIERHGGTVMGSTRAEVQYWRVNLSGNTAEITGVGRRQLKPMQKRLDISPLAEEIADAITNHREHQWLTWSNNGSVQVQTSKVLPPAPNQTMEGRRTRLFAAIDNLVSHVGWARTGGRYQMRAE